MLTNCCLVGMRNSFRRYRRGSSASNDSAYDFVCALVSSEKCRGGPCLMCSRCCLEPILRYTACSGVGKDIGARSGCANFTCGEANESSTDRPDSRKGERVRSTLQHLQSKMTSWRQPNKIILPFAPPPTASYTHRLWIYRQFDDLSCHLEPNKDQSIHPSPVGGIHFGLVM